ncbi:MAG: TonB C-terminal domain-containing protein [Candidatus Aminicenantes bacterium]|nr:TonB C-terminal domain-containing protein [Candidatus Aminicenantes bacterium]
MLFEPELRPNWSLKLVIFLFSLVIHGFILILLIQAFTPVTIINFPVKVTAVTIVPREGLILPSGPDQGTSAGATIKSKTAGIGESGPSTARLQEKMALLDREATIPFSKPRPPGPMPYPPFNLIPRPKGETSSFTLKLPAPPEKERIQPSEQRLRPGSPHDYWRYVLAIEPGKEKKEAIFGVPIISGSGPISPQVPRVSIEGPGYDLSPWAQEVVARLQKNWQITASKAALEKGTLHLQIGVDRSGEITFMRIILSSQKAAFDRAALEAINLSLPLPRLPEGLPTDSLELTVIFECEESRK